MRTERERYIRAHGEHIHQIGRHHEDRAKLAKSAYLGSFYEYTFDGELGSIFVVSPDLVNVLVVGADVSLSLSSHGVSVVAVS